MSNTTIIVTIETPDRYQYDQDGTGRRIVETPDRHVTLHTYHLPHGGDKIELDGKIYKVYSNPIAVFQSTGGRNHYLTSHYEMVVNPV